MFMLYISGVRLLVASLDNKSTSEIFVSGMRGVSGVQGVDGVSGMFLPDLLEFVVEGVAKFNSFGTSPVE